MKKLIYGSGSRKPICAIIIFIISALAAPTLFAQVSVIRPPQGYDEAVIFLADGMWNINDPHPVVPGCGFLGIFCDGLYFQEQINGLSPVEIAAAEAAAKDWFLRRFGIDVDDPANIGRIEFFDWMADPRWEYRVYYWSKQPTPTNGLEIRDGGWAVMITDPDGYTFGGELAGRHVPAGSMGVVGNYNVLLRQSRGRERVENIYYRADNFMEFDAANNLIIDCQLSKTNFADDQMQGAAQGMGSFVLDADGNLLFTSRNILLFPPRP